MSTEITSLFDKSANSNLERKKVDEDRDAYGKRWKAVAKKKSAEFPSTFSLHIQWDSTRTRVYLTLANAEKSQLWCTTWKKGAEFAQCATLRMQKRD